jgi:hypothetical protein
VLKAVQEGQLIDKDGTQGKALSSKQAFGGNLSMSSKDALEVFIKIFHGDGTQFVKDPADFHAIIGMGVAAILGRHQQTVIALTDLMEVRSVVMAITQHKTNVCGNFPQQERSRIALSATLAGVSTAARGNQTLATTETTCSFQP